MSEAKGPYRTGYERGYYTVIDGGGVVVYSDSEVSGVNMFTDAANYAHHHALAAQAERVKDLELLVSIYKRASDALDGMGYTLPHSTPLGDDERRWYERGISTTKRCFREAFEEAVQEATDAALTPPVKETT